MKGFPLALFAENTAELELLVGGNLECTQNGCKKTVEKKENNFHNTCMKYATFCACRTRRKMNYFRSMVENNISYALL